MKRVLAVAAGVLVLLVAASAPASASQLVQSNTTAVMMQGYCDPSGGNCTCVGAHVGGSYVGECGFGG